MLLPEKIENKESFFSRFVGRVGPTDLLKLQTAYMMAKHGHRGQRRNETDGDGNPLRYFEHSRRVAITLPDQFGIYDIDYVCTALLHDTLEDCEDISAEMLEMIFGETITKGVISVTKFDGHKDTYFEQVKSNVIGSVVKLSDKLDNMRSLPHESLKDSDIRFVTKQIKELGETFLPTFEHRYNDYNVGIINAIKELKNIYCKLSGNNYNG